MRNIDLRIGFAHLLRAADAFRDCGVYVAGVMHQNHFRAVVPHQLPSLFGHGVRHYDDGAVAAHRADERESYALVPARWFDDDRI